MRQKVLRAKDKFYFQSIDSSGKIVILHLLQQIAICEIINYKVNLLRNNPTFAGKKFTASKARYKDFMGIYEWLGSRIDEGFRIVILEIAAENL